MALGGIPHQATKETKTSFVSFVSFVVRNGGGLFTTKGTRSTKREQVSNSRHYFVSFVCFVVKICPSRKRPLARAPIVDQGTKRSRNSLMLSGARMHTSF